MKARLIAQLFFVGLGLALGIAGSMLTGSEGPFWAGLVFAGIMATFAALDFSGHQGASTGLAIGLGATIVASEIHEHRASED